MSVMNSCRLMGSPSFEDQGGRGAVIAGEIEEPASAIVQPAAAVSGTAFLMAHKKAPRRSAGPSFAIVHSVQRGALPCTERP
jgi:hypothetical protein